MSARGLKKARQKIFTNQPSGDQNSEGWPETARDRLRRRALVDDVDAISGCLPKNRRSFFRDPRVAACVRQGGGTMKLSLSQHELAEMAGRTRENVNRYLRGWQRQGILDLKDRWTIVCPTR